MVKSHLGFVISNLWMTSAITNKDQVKYAVGCFSMEEEVDEDDMLINIQNQIALNQEQNSSDVAHLQDDLSSIHIGLEDLSNKI